MVCDKLGLERYAEVPMVQQIAHVSHQKPEHCILGCLVLLILTALTTPGQWLVYALATFFYPSFKSFKAIQNGSEDDDKKWLTYWIVFGFWHAFDEIIMLFFFWIPYFNLLKFGFLCALYMPQLGGSVHVYDRFIRPVMKKIEPIVDEPLKRIEDLLMLN